MLGIRDRRYRNPQGIRIMKTYCKRHQQFYDKDLGCRYCPTTVEEEGLFPPTFITREDLLWRLWTHDQAPLALQGCTIYYLDDGDPNINRSKAEAAAHIAYSYNDKGVLELLRTDHWPMGTPDSNLSPELKQVFKNIRYMFSPDPTLGYVYLRWV